MPITVIGIDPGSRVTGIGIVRETSGVLQLVHCVAIKAKGKEDNFSERLAFIYKELIEIIKEYAPQEAAVEQVFTAHNPASALKLGQARGVAIAACAAYGLPVSDYAPTMIKKSLVGTGGADKSQVAFMVGRLLNVKPEWPLDVSDALAIALCHLNLRRFAQLTARK